MYFKLLINFILPGMYYLTTKIDSRTKWYKAKMVFWTK